MRLLASQPTIIFTRNRDLLRHSKKKIPTTSHKRAAICLPDIRKPREIRTSKKFSSKKSAIRLRKTLRTKKTLERTGYRENWDTPRPMGPGPDTSETATRGQLNTLTHNLPSRIISELSPLKSVTFLNKPPQNQASSTSKNSKAKITGTESTKIR